MLLPLQDSRKSQGNTFFEEIRFGATTSTIFVRYLQKSITINQILGVTIPSKELFWDDVYQSHII